MDRIVAHCEGGIIYITVLSPADVLHIGIGSRLFTTMDEVRAAWPGAEIVNLGDR